MTLIRALIAASLYALAGLTFAQTAAPPADAATSSDAPTVAAPAVRGGPADWLGQVECVVSPSSAAFRCFSDPDTEILSCKTDWPRFFVSEKSWGRPRPFDGLGHGCVEQEEKTYCTYTDPNNWSCGRFDRARFKVTAPARVCYFTENRGEQGTYDCRLYDLATGQKAHLIRCAVENPLRNGARRILCNPIETSPAHWL